MARGAATTSTAGWSPSFCRGICPAIRRSSRRTCRVRAASWQQKYMYEVAPKDGTVFGSLAQTLALDSMTNTNAKLDVAKMPYIGRVVTNIDTGAALPKTGITSFEDVRAKQYNVGASGGGSTTVLFPTALNTYAGAKFKLIRGYSGTVDILLAMERGEVDIVGAYGLPGILVTHPGWVHGSEATILYQASLKRHPLLKHVPTLPELA